MNLSKLFEIQKVLDTKIIETHGLQGKDLLPNLILALQVELGELANEWRGFKHWSKDQEPRTSVPVNNGYKTVYKNPLLEEYVDCLHFILSIGNHLDIPTLYQVEIKSIHPTKSDSTIAQFLHVQYRTSLWTGKSVTDCWVKLTSDFLGLGEILGFKWEQIESAYLAKNAINHERQESGY